MKRSRRLDEAAAARSVGIKHLGRADGRGCGHAESLTVRQKQRCSKRLCATQRLCEASAGQDQLSAELVHVTCAAVVASRTRRASVVRLSQTSA
jgi:hypothetical protein